MLQDKITMDFGAGGRATQDLIDKLFKKAFDNEFLQKGDDQAIFPVPFQNAKVALTTDTHVVYPLFFRGGNIGDLAVNGTVNDLVVGGAIPYYLSAGFVIEEGFDFLDLKRIVDSMAMAAKKAGVFIVTGDTKVVEKGAVDGLFINTAGVGFVPEGLFLSVNNVQQGDVIILSADIARHGIAVLASRKGMEFETNITSDTVALNPLTNMLVKEFKNDIVCMRDATRGGVAAVLNEIAATAGVGILIDENKILVSDEVNAVCDMFGYDALDIASEGVMIVVVKQKSAAQVLNLMRGNPLASNAQIIGKTLTDENHLVQMNTKIGGTRLVEWSYGEQLPRIC